MLDIASIVENIRGGTMVGISAMTLMSNLFPGLPEEIFLILVGYVVALGGLSWWLGYLLLLIPLMISDGMLFMLARSGNEFVMRAQKKVLGDLLEKHKEVFEQKRDILLFGTRFLFHFRIIGPIVAGITKMPIKRFVLINFVTLSVFINLMLWIGHYLRERFVDIKDGIGVVQEVMKMAFLVVVGIIIFFILKKYLKTWLSHIGNATERGLSFLGITFNPSEFRIFDVIKNINNNDNAQKTQQDGQQEKSDK